MIASCTSAGEINIWQTTTNEAWSAFAPGFEELEENREYVEREDEFDLVSDKLFLSNVSTVPLTDDTLCSSGR